MGETRALQESLCTVFFSGVRVGPPTSAVHSLPRGCVTRTIATLGQHRFSNPTSHCPHKEHRPTGIIIYADATYTWAKQSNGRTRQTFPLCRVTRVVTLLHDLGVFLPAIPIHFSL